MPPNFKFGEQSDVLSYKQLGNGVAVGAVYQVVKAAINRDSDILSVTNPQLLKSVEFAPSARGKVSKKNKKSLA
jgi:DNA (cytosine-5)-methyltransferase 1